MAIYGQNILTNLGKDLLIRALANSEKINFTIIKFGKGVTSGKVEDLTDIVEEFKKLPIISTEKLKDGGYRIRVPYDNIGLTTDTYLKEIGVFAKGEEGIEVLYSYCSTTTPDLIPAESAGLITRVEDIIEINGYYNVEDELSEKRQISSIKGIDYITLQNGLYTNSIVNYKSDEQLKVKTEKKFGALPITEKGEKYTEDSGHVEYPSIQDELINSFSFDKSGLTTLMYDNSFNKVNGFTFKENNKITIAPSKSKYLFNKNPVIGDLKKFIFSCFQDGELKYTLIKSRVSLYEESDKIIVEGSKMVIFRSVDISKKPFLDIQLEPGSRTKLNVRFNSYSPLDGSEISSTLVETINLHENVEFLKNGRYRYYLPVPSNSTLNGLESRKSYSQGNRYYFEAIGGDVTIKATGLYSGIDTSKVIYNKKIFDSGYVHIPFLSTESFNKISILVTNSGTTDVIVEDLILEVK